VGSGRAVYVVEKRKGSGAAGVVGGMADTK
jgi:hypothetical protein